jgi:ATP phosphoribosyltransferase
MEMVKVALAKGRLGKQVVKLMENTPYGDVVDLDSRKLIFNDNFKNIQYILMKPMDVPTYVNSGIVDIGVVGKDVIMESEADIYEIKDLGIGKCKFSIAALKGSDRYKQSSPLRIATKYPNVAREYYKDEKRPIKIFKLNGSVELAPLIGMSDVILDIVETGNTLRANGLEVIADVCDISGKIIANKGSYRFKYKEITDFVNQF